MIMLELKMEIYEKEKKKKVGGSVLRETGERSCKNHHFVLCYLMLQMMSPSSILYSLFLYHIFFQFPLYIFKTLQIMKSMTIGNTEDRCL